MTTCDVRDLTLIYSDTYQYSLPKNILENFLQGTAFDNKTPYTTQELEQIYQDINNLFQKTITVNPDKVKIAYITAGAPGAGKTTLTHQILDKKILEENVAYVCPDDTGLPALTGYQQISKENPTAAYTKLRPASNGAMHWILANLIRENYAFYFGSTSSSPLTGKFFEFLKKQGYEIRLIHVTAPDDVRWKSIQERDKTIIQTTEQDIKEKGRMVYERLNDTFLKFADRIDFYYRDEVDLDAQQVATWYRNADNEKEPGTLEIVNASLYGPLKNVHNEAMKLLKPNEDLSWEATIEKHSKVLIPMI